MKNFNTDKIIIALGLHRQDDCLLEYVEFLNRQFDFNEITALHVLPKSTPALEAETAQAVTDYRAQEDYEEQLEESIEDYISNRCGQAERYLVKFGNIEEEVLKTTAEEKPQLLFFGQKNNTILHALSAERIVCEAKTTLLSVPEGSQPKIRKILVPVDFSDPSIEALKSAVAFNKQLKNPAKITVLNVTGNEDGAGIGLQNRGGTMQKLREDSRRDFLKILIKKNLPKELKHLKIKVVSRGEDTPAEAIVKYAERKEFDFVVMGAKGNSAFSMLLFGSTTAAVVKEIRKIPVMVIKEFAQDLSENQNQ